MTVIDLKNKLNTWKNDEHESLTYILNPEYNTHYILLCLVDFNLDMATYNIVVNNNFLLSRNYFYQSSLLNIYLHEMFDNGTHTSANIFTTHFGFCHSIISDSNKIIAKCLEYEDNFLNTFGSAFIKAIQASVKNDDIALQNQIKNLIKHTDKKRNAKHYNGVPIAFSGILQNDKVLVEQGINEILAKHNKQAQRAVLKDFINIEALTLAKLAFRRGILVEIDNPLLPIEMIPIHELENYESYDFLNIIESTL